MRRFIALGTGLLLLVLGTQIVLAAYSAAGPVNVSTSSPAAGAPVTVSGEGYAANSEVRITIQSTPQLLATVTTDASGNFEASVTIPAGFAGAHEIVATGADPQGSVRVLETAITVAGSGSAPSTNTVGGEPVRSSDGTILAVAGAAIVLVSAGFFVFSRRGVSR